MNREQQLNILGMTGMSLQVTQHCKHTIESNCKTHLQKNKQQAVMSVCHHIIM